MNRSDRHRDGTECPAQWRPVLLIFHIFNLVFGGEMACRLRVSIAERIRLYAHRMCQQQGEEAPDPSGDPGARWWPAGIGQA